MIKKLGVLAFFPLFLTACSNQHQVTEIASDNENIWEHSTPKAITKTETSPFISETEKGWVPSGKNETFSSSETMPYPSLPTHNNSSTVIDTLVNHRVVTDDIYTSTIVENPEVVRYDRYLLVDSEPQNGQKYLLEQMVTVNMKGVGLSVENGMWNTLTGTGYSLCSPVNQAVSSLFRLQLPKVHYKFGPVHLRDALQMLAGEAYELTVNDALRQVCYVPRKTEAPTKTAPKTIVYADAESP